MPILGGDAALGDAAFGDAAFGDAALGEVARALENDGASEEFGEGGAGEGRGEEPSEGARGAVLADGVGAVKAGLRDIAWWQAKSHEGPRRGDALVVTRRTRERRFDMTNTAQ